MTVAAIDRSIQALLQERPRPLRTAPVTPDCQPRKLCRHDTPLDKPVKPVASRPAADESKSAKNSVLPVEVDALAKVAPSITTVLGKLFSALDVVLGLSANRGSHLLEAVRQGVEIHSGHELDDARLAQVLKAAGGMLGVRWLSAGTAARLEIWQVAPDGKTRVPTPAELSERRAAFVTALASAAQAGGVLPQAVLPPRPAACASDHEMRPEPKRECDDDDSSKTPVDQSVACGGNAADRLHGIRQRMLVRQLRTQEAAGMKHRLDTLQQQIGAHDDASTLHAVVVQLFGRFSEGQKASASDAEVIHAVQGSLTGAMCKRSMDTNTARSALSCLAAVADLSGWFHVEEALYSQSFFLVQNPGGSAAEALTSLREKLTALRTEQQQLLKVIATSTVATSVVAAEAHVLKPKQNKSSNAVDGKPSCAVVCAAPKGRDARAKVQAKAAAKTKAKTASKKKSVWVG